MVADCSSAKVRPTTITVACGDGGAWVQGMTWTSWGPATATGSGQFYQNTCQPNCAEGKPASYPARVTLSGVENDPAGAYFSHLTVTWEGSAPPGSGSAPASYKLTTPSRQ